MDYNINYNIKDLINEKLKKIYGNNIPKRILERCKNEVELIINKNLEQLYLAIYLISKKIDLDNEKYILNGTSSSFYILYLLGISKINPIKWDIPYQINLDSIDNFEIAISPNYYRKEKVEFEKISKEYKVKENINFVENPYLEVLNTKTANENKNIYKYNLLIDNNQIIKYNYELGNKIISKIKIKNVSDLVNVYALIKGSELWENNIEKIIEKYDLNKLPITRDNIYNFLSNKGIKEAYEIMLFVSKGKQRYKENIDKWNRYKNIMKYFKVDDYYIEILEKASYIYPKAHCVYTMNIYYESYFN